MMNVFIWLNIRCLSLQNVCLCSYAQISLALSIGSMIKELLHCKLQALVGKPTNMAVDFLDFVTLTVVMGSYIIHLMEGDNSTQ